MCHTSTHHVIVGEVSLESAQGETFVADGREAVAVLFSSLAELFASSSEIDILLRHESSSCGHV